MEIFWWGIKWVIVAVCVLFFAGLFISFCSNIIINNWFRAKLFFEKMKENMQKEDKNGR